MSNSKLLTKTAKLSSFLKHSNDIGSLFTKLTLVANLQRTKNISFKALVFKSEAFFSDEIVPKHETLMKMYKKYKNTKKYIVFENIAIFRLSLSCSELQFSCSFCFCSLKRANSSSTMLNEIKVIIVRMKLGTVNKKTKTKLLKHIPKNIN